MLNFNGFLFFLNGMELTVEQFTVCSTVFGYVDSVKRLQRDRWRVAGEENA